MTYFDDDPPSRFQFTGDAPAPIHRPLHQRTNRMSTTMKIQFSDDSGTIARNYEDPTPNTHGAILPRGNHRVTMGSGGDDELGITAKWVQPAIAPTSSASKAPPSVDMSSVRSPTGLPLHDMTEFTPDATITVDGIETTIEVAVSMGALVRDPNTGILRPADGSSERADEGRQPSERQTQQQADAPESTVLDEQSEAFLANAFSEAPDAALGAASAIIEADGVLSNHHRDELAGRLGIEPTEVERRVAHVHAAYSREAAETSAKAVGTSAEVAAEALADARTTNPHALRQAAESHVLTGKADYAAFVQSYIAGLGTSDPRRVLEAAPVAGRAVRWDAGAATVVVDMPDGTTVSWEVAVLQGLISFR